jgi:DNA-binding transcriptional ArsR family regulator
MAGSGEEAEPCDRRTHYRRAAVLHPVRIALLRLMPDDGDVEAAWLAARLGAQRARVAHHLRVLTRHGALRIVPRRRPAPPHYRHPADREWVRKLLDLAEGPEADDD